jgi:hypothetical protein
MSASFCIKCEKMVGGYEKYCDDCVKKYGVKQDRMWHKTYYFTDWNTERAAEFAKDAQSTKERDLRKHNPDKPKTTIYVYHQTPKATKQSDPAYRKRFGSRPH